MLGAMVAGCERLSADELLDSLCCGQRDADGIARTPELLGEFGIEEAVQMGAFFDDPDEQAAFDRAVEARGLRYP